MSLRFAGDNKDINEIMESVMKKYRLIFLWVGNYRNLNNIGIHFTNQFKFSYDNKTGVLRIAEKNLSYIKDFYCLDSDCKDIAESEFQTSIDFSAIVGNNAVGKTTILRFIYEYVGKSFQPEAHKYDDVAIRYFEIYMDLIENKLIVIPHKVKMVIADEFKECIVKKECISNITKLYYTNAFNYNDYIRVEKDKYDLSTGYLMNCSNDPIKKAYDEQHVTRYTINEFRNQSNFVTAYINGKWLDAFDEMKDFKIPSNAIFTLRDSSHGQFIFSDIDWEKEDKINLKKKMNNLLNYLNSWRKILYEDFASFEYSSYYASCKHHVKNFELHLCHTVINSLYYSLSTNNSNIIYWIIEESERYLSVKNQENKEMSDIKKTVTYFEFLQELVMRDRESATIIDEHIKFLNFIEEKLVKEPVQMDGRQPGIYIRSENYMELDEFVAIGLDAEEYDKYNDMFEFFLPSVTIEEFMHEYKKLSRYYDCFSFSWEGVSSGENALLSLFGRLYSVKKTSNNVLLLIDEADMLFHPEWQRRYIELMYKILPIIYPKKNIQVIIATHSPIMLSDIPKQNVQFLKSTLGKNKKRKTIIVDGCDTFSANIFRLFQDAFFVEDTGIGSFAEKKLKDIVKMIHSEEKRQNNILALINTVGDKYLRAKLMQEYMIYQITEDEETNVLKLENRRKEETIKQLQEELKKLKAEYCKEEQSYD